MKDEELLPGEELIEALENLRSKLNRSGVQRTAGLREAMGLECDYYWKSLNVFIKRDYKELRSLVKLAEELFQKVEKDNGP